MAGIGPESSRGRGPSCAVCRPVVVGDAGWLGKALMLVGSKARAYPVGRVDEIDADGERVPCLTGSRQDLSGVTVGKISAAGGQAAYDCLCTAIDLTRAGAADGIVTAPLHKEGLRAAGLHYPGHTEILAERTGTQSFAMLLYSQGLAVAHVTLHMALRDVFRHLSRETVLDKIRLLDRMLQRLLGRKPRLGVAALNPHASDGGLFGDEEASFIRPAVEAAEREGITASGPWPCDALFVRARRGEFDGVVAMYHDQGHIALKPARGAVNIRRGCRSFAPASPTAFATLPARHADAEEWWKRSAWPGALPRLNQPWGGFPDPSVRVQGGLGNPPHVRFRHEDGVPALRERRKPTWPTVSKQRAVVAPPLARMGTGKPSPRAIFAIRPIDFATAVHCCERFRRLDRGRAHGCRAAGG